MDVILQFPHLTPAQQQAILNGPALIPPDGVEPNLENPSNNNALAIAVSVVGLTLVVISGIGRIYSRVFVVKKLKVEDYLGLAAFGGYAGVAWAFYSQLVYGGFFVHQWDVRFGDFQNALYSAVLLTIVYAITMIFAKAAILLEWVHIFVPNREHRLFFWGAHILIVLNVLLYGSGIIAEALACIPLATIWKPWLMGKCIDKRKLDITTAYFNLAVDVFILVLPQTVIWKLHMPREKKIGVSVIFSIGLLVVATATGRVYANTMLRYVNEGDTNYGFTPLYLWAFSEVSCVLLVFNAPALPKAINNSWIGTRLIPRIDSWIKVSSWKQSGGNTQSPKPWPHGGKAANDNPYREMDDQSQEIELSKNGAALDSQYALDDGTILRHTEFQTREDTISQSSNNPRDISMNQHPWMQT
ncbi:hypothetical protein F5B22DRAFT_648961 [Xylaria bambusicola]|uniref:uncharacterized protein n=1 Tax=Xylaria bambusicola TaxID=326684 RepID=UPI002008EA34|nr:uncharacterized protein F5B22DRAFT_648961 [Xylaria bambusicola]KAI0509535.1 hypothetical protein F5B22DRAFT_648961 [Xylaria bambusicola]